MQTHERHIRPIVWYILATIVLGGLVLSALSVWWQYHQAAKEPLTWLGGTVTAVTGDTLLVSNQNATTTVRFSSATPIRFKRTDITPTQLRGKAVNINGVRAADGVFNATYIRVLNDPSPRWQRK